MLYLWDIGSVDVTVGRSIGFKVRQTEVMRVFISFIKALKVMQKSSNNTILILILIVALIIMGINLADHGVGTSGSAASVAFRKASAWWAAAESNAMRSSPDSAS